MSESDLVADLKAAASRAGNNAWSPHSKFQVGAATSGENGPIYVGCNVESDSYGLTQCAERNAIGAAVVDGTKKGYLQLMVVHVPGNKALPPCGACRQVMYELMAPGAKIISFCDSDHSIAWTREELMPHAFSMDSHNDAEQ